MSFTVTAERGCPQRFGATPVPGGVEFALFSSAAETAWLCLFEPGEPLESQRLALPGREGDVFYGFVPGLGEGALYGLRASGPFAPERGARFDERKLLVDPYALRLDRPFRHDAALCNFGTQTAPLVPRAIVSALPKAAPPLPAGAPGFTYEVLTRGFSMRHPGVRPDYRGTVLAFTEEAVLDDLARLGVETVEFMPLAAWIDERHLPPLGLSNAWGYNPIAHMAPDPRLAPGGLPDIARAVSALHGRGIRVLLDVVLNHSGESDELGPTLSYRGLDNAAYYRLRQDDAALYVNDTGTGNTFAAERAPVVQLFLDTLRTWAEATGIDGFRYDLAPVLGRDAKGFSPDAPFFRALAKDPVLKNRIHVAEAWDIGPGGYRVGEFPPPFIEWQDRFRDDVRRFWRGDRSMVPALAMRLAGSHDLFEAPSRGVNMIAAHDGFTLADITMYERRHNEANGEGNRDGHADNHSWNNGHEGPTDDPAIIARRGRDMRALLATLFLSRGNLLLVAGDEFGRTQHGNNNAYAQDNATTWLDWARADMEIAAMVARLAALRRRFPALGGEEFAPGGSASWLSEHGRAMENGEWDDPSRRFLGFFVEDGAERLIAYFNAAQADVPVLLPTPDGGRDLVLELQSDRPDLPPRALDPGAGLVVTARSVFVLVESASA
ncbi:glycogen debranching protein GlgX [Aureimonas mangrovi]|uniref:glycogen debranching protein GlgX n=1 Tax=Aureimonas mangrovi TaxID=2758041 RepID=UPI00163D7D6C|nr:glycogen debranching protein GlgX [Aureimonas mangrovi]